MLRLLTVLILTTAVLQDGRAQSAEALAERVRAHYAAMASLSANFIQVMDADLFDAPQEVSGRLMLRGAAYRVEVGDDVFVADGETSWVYRAAERQVLIDTYEPDASTLSVNELLFRFHERFRAQGATRSDGPEGRSWSLDLVPLDAGDFFRSVRLTVRNTDTAVTHIQVLDANDVTIDITLRDIRENPDLPDTLFRFEAPDGVDVVDLRS